MNVTSENMTQSHFEDYIILVVDDNSTNLGVLSDYLEDQGFTTRVASSGELALQRAKRIQPALILLDVMMPPGIDGFETCRRLKANESTKDIPVIFMTALSSTKDKVKGFSVGGVDYITKPIQHEEVLARVTTHLRIRDLTLNLSAKIEELIRTRDGLVQSEKMASLGRLVAGFAHEINTPIGIAVGAISSQKIKTEAIEELLKQDEVDEDELFGALEIVSEAANLSLSNLNKAAHLVHSFKRAAIDQTTENVVQFEVKALIEGIITTLNSKFNETAIEIQVDCSEDLSIESVPGRLEQILVHLMINSWVHGFEEGKNAGKINIAVALNDKNFHFEYSDTGKGIAPENLEKIFEPFFTGYRGHGGSGLGLYVCYNIVTAQLNGSITCESTPGNGAQFIIDFPAETSE